MTKIGRCIVKLMVVCMLMSASVFSQSVVRKPFKLISYNIWDGLSHGTSCRAKLVSWVKGQNPDVVALQELVGFDGKKLSALAAEYGHPHAEIIKVGGYPVGITSRRPIQVVAKFVEGYWHGMMHVRTYDLDLIVTHLSPFSWQYRLAEAKKITQYIESHDLTKCMVMGDLNAYSPFDADEVETHAALRSGMLSWDKSHPQWGNMRGERFDYSVLSELYSIGLRDAIQLHVPVAKRMTYPAACLYGQAWSAPLQKSRGERLDYILLSEALVSGCENACVHNGPENEGISDHYPVSVMLNLPAN